MRDLLKMIFDTAVVALTTEGIKLIVSKAKIALTGDKSDSDDTDD